MKLQEKLNDMTKSELLEFAEENKVKVYKSWKVAKIKNAILDEMVEPEEVEEEEITITDIENMTKAELQDLIRLNNLDVKLTQKVKPLRDNIISVLNLDTSEDFTNDFENWSRKEMLKEIKAINERNEFTINPVGKKNEQLVEALEQVDAGKVPEIASKSKAKKKKKSKKKSKKSKKSKKKSKKKPRRSKVPKRVKERRERVAIVVDELHKQDPETYEDFNWEAPYDRIQEKHEIHSIHHWLSSKGIKEFVEILLNGEINQGNH